VLYIKRETDIIANNKDEYDLEVRCELVHFHSNRKVSISVLLLACCTNCKEEQRNRNSCDNDDGLTQVYTHLLTISWTLLRHTC
jgi:hypothetical protein